MGAQVSSGLNGAIGPGRWVRLRPPERALAAGLALLFLALLVAARLIQPDPRGLGTHEQLGLRPCYIAKYLHLPCPLCGATTAFSLMAHGAAWPAFRCQPTGALAAMACAAAFGLSAVFALSGRFPQALFSAFATRTVAVLAAAAVLMAWVYKILATLL